jgi:hypothetical protein
MREEMTGNNTTAAEGIVNPVLREIYTVASAVMLLQVPGEAKWSDKLGGYCWEPVQEFVKSATI